MKADDLSGQLFLCGLGWRRDGEATPVDDEVELRSVLATIGRIRSGQHPPLRARTLTESMMRCRRRVQTRALDHWAKRR